MKEGDKKKEIKKLSDIKEEEAWTDWTYSSTIWNFNVGKNGREGVHGLEDIEKTQYHARSNPNKLYVNTAFAGKLVPHLVRKLIHKYSKKGDLILDAFCGSGTIPVEAKINERRWIAIDVNPLCVDLTRRKLKTLDVKSFDDLSVHAHSVPSDNNYNVYEGDARKLNSIVKEQIDLILTHPPYWGLIDFSKLDNDLSTFTLEEYLKAMKEILTQFYEVLKPNGYCVLIIGDSRKRGVVPLGSYLTQIGLKLGFNLWDLMIYDTRFGGKQVHKFRKIRSQQKKFHLTDHDYILVFQKREKGWKYVNVDDIFA